MTLPWRGTTPEISSEADSRYETPGGAQNKVDSAYDILLNLLKLAVTGLSDGSEAAIARNSTPYGITYDWLKDRLDAVDQRDISFNTLLAEIDLKASNPVTEISDNTIPSSKLKKTSNSDKVGLLNLKQEVIDAMAGTAPVISYVDDGTITPEKTSFLGINRVNLFDETLTVSGYVNAANGTITANSGAFTSDFMRIDDSKAYTTNGTWTAAYYDANKAFVSSIASNFGTRQTPAGVGIKFLRMSFDVASQTGIGMVVEGNTLPSSFVPYTDYSIAITDDNFKKSLTYSGSIISGLKCNLLGDSITSGGATTKSYYNYINEQYGVIFQNYGISGSTVADYSFAGQNNPMCLRYTSMDNDADMILVFGGTNDTGLPGGFGTMADRSRNSFYGACHVLYKGLIEKYPNKKIGMITPCRRGDAPASILQQYVDAEIEVANYYSLPILDLYRKGGLTENVPSVFSTQMDAGLLHPNATGHSILSRSIASFMLTL